RPRPARARARGRPRPPRRAGAGSRARPIRYRARAGQAREPAHLGDALGTAGARRGAAGGRLGAPRARPVRHRSPGGRRGRVSALAPGPRGLEVASTLFRLRRDPLRSFLDARARWGAVIRVPLGKRTFYLIASPAGARHVLCENARNYNKDTWSYG